ncbi:MAG: long-chain fatty acid--CoA ligase [Acidobacteriota bacterium]
MTAPTMADIETLSDLFFRIREVSAGHTDLLTLHRAESLETQSTTDFVRSVHSLALALDDAGVAAGDRIAIWSETRPEWHVVAFACHLLAAPTVPIHPGVTADELAWALRNSGARWIFVADGAKLDILATLASTLTAPPRVVTFDPVSAAEPSATTLTRLLGQGARRLGEVPIERYRGRAGAEDLASLLYTSGTSGEPKGVMLSHRNLVSNVLACDRVFPLQGDDVALAFLPLSHIFQRTVDHLCFYRGVRLVMVPDPDDVGAALERHRPTVMAAAPELYERAWRRLRRDEADAAPPRRALVRWALEIGARYAEATRGGFIGPLLSLQRALANRLVLRRVRERFGGRLRLAISGGAPLAPEIGELFEAAGLPLYEGYGLTETSPVLTTNHPDGQRRGSVGQALSDVELRIAEDGEILVRGPNVMQGYWQSPDATAASIDSSGWFRTGDIGRLDQSGYLFVTDRKRDLLVLSNGHNVAPRPIEALLRADELIEQAVVVGDGRPHAAALLLPDTGRLTARLDTDSWRDDPRTTEAIQAVVDRVNERLAKPNRLRSWGILARALSREDDELTPTLKIRRKAVHRHFADQIEALYRAPDLVAETSAGTRAPAD